MPTSQLFGKAMIFYSQHFRKASSTRYGFQLPSSTLGVLFAHWSKPVQDEFLFVKNLHDVKCYMNQPYYPMPVLIH